MSDDQHLTSADLVRDLEQRVRRFCELTGRGPSGVSRSAVGDSAWLKNVMQGSGFQTRIYDRFQAWLDANWPEEAVSDPSTEVDGSEPTTDHIRI